jgi:hypothetical protein
MSETSTETQFRTVAVADLTVRDLGSEVSVDGEPPMILCKILDALYEGKHPGRSLGLGPNGYDGDDDDELIWDWFDERNEDGETRPFATPIEVRPRAAGQVRS